MYNLFNDFANMNILKIKINIFLLFKVKGQKSTLTSYVSGLKQHTNIIFYSSYL